MFSLETVAKIIDEKSPRYIFYGPKKDEYLYYKTIQEAEKRFPAQKEDKDSDWPFLAVMKKAKKEGYYWFDYHYDSWQLARKGFFDDHKRKLRKLVPEKPSHASWKKAMEKTGLEKEWLLYLEMVLSFDSDYFVHLYDIQEKEASMELYSKIKALLDEIQSCHYEKLFSDQHLFSFVPRFGFHPIYFSFLGNGGITYGLDLILENAGHSLYRLSEYSDYLGLDQMFLYSLSQSVNFYYGNAGDREDKRFDNPFGIDNDTYSVSFDNGIFMDSYFSESTALLVFNCLNGISILMDQYVQTVPAFDPNQDYLMDFEENKLTSYEQFDAMDGSFIKEYFDRCVHYPDKKNYRIHKNKLEEFVIRCLGPEKNRLIPQKEVYPLLYACGLANHTTGKIDKAIASNGKDKKPFATMVKDLDAYFQENGVPETFLAKNYAEACFLINFFREEIEEGIVKIERSQEQFAVDDFFDRLK